MAIEARKESTLDPEDWSEFAALAHRAVDDAVDFLRSVRERPVWQPVSGDATRALSEPVPFSGQGIERAYADFSENVMPFPIGNIHPRFWGLVMGSGAPAGVLAEFLAAVMNTNCPGFDQSATLVEERVVDWFREIFGMPPTTSGLFVNGATMANLLALLVARNAKAPFDARADGIVGRSRLRIYASSETHSWLKRACNVLGLGERAIRFVRADERQRMDIAELRRAVHEDRHQGHIPFFVNANAGTVNTGASDDFSALADVCAEENLWLHVDGAFGAMAALAPRAKAEVAGMDRADSIAFDLHKWGYLPYGIACVLVRDGQAHRAALSNPAPYLTAGGGLASKAPLHFSDLGIELSRGFIALKAWMALKAYGFERLGEMIQQNVDQAAYLARTIEQTPELELLAPAPLNVVCFRYVAPPGMDPDTFNAELVAAVQQSGDAVFTGTIFEGRFGIRAAITNHRTTFADIDMAVAAILREGRLRAAAA